MASKARRKADKGSRPHPGEELAAPALPSLVLFARVPEAGRVKTRLAPILTARGATELYRAFLEDASRSYLRPAAWQSVICAAPTPWHAEMRALFSDAWRREAQSEGDLGERLRFAFEREFSLGAPAAVAVGSDHPGLASSRLEEVFDVLARRGNAVLVPAEDGGVCAIGLATGTPLREAFADIPWSTEEVLESIVSRLEAAGVRVHILASGYDVDRPEDLERLRLDLESRDPAGEDYPLATARVLAALAPGPSSNGPRPPVRGRPAAVSIIVPIRNEAAEVGRDLARWWRPQEAEMLIADDTRSPAAEVLRRAGARVVDRSGSRGARLAHAVSLARGDILFFLHGDSRPPDGAIDLLRESVRSGAAAGAFSLAYDDPDRKMRWVAWWANQRSRRFLLPLGDQGIFCSREAYAAAGGFRDLPLCDDVDFVRRIKRVGRFSILPDCVVTSGRRYRRKGVARQTLVVWKVLAGYFLGVDPARLARWYSGR